VEFFVGMDHIGLFTSNLEDAMGIAQHHDAVSGTAKQHTTDDYSKRLALGASKVEKGVNTALTCLTSSNGTCISSVGKLKQVRIAHIFSLRFNTNFFVLGKGTVSGFLHHPIHTS